MKQIVKINIKGSDLTALESMLDSFNLKVQRVIGDWMILTGNPSDVIAFEETSGITTYAPF